MKKVIVNFSRAVLMVMAMPMNALAQFEKPSEVSNAEAVLSRNIGTTWKVLLWIALIAIVLGLVIAGMRYFSSGGVKEEEQDDDME